jgi:hypothetical protein
MKQSQTTLFVVILAAAALARVIDHPWNIAPIGALALFVGAYCRNRLLALSVPLMVMAVSDIAIGALRQDMAFYTFHSLTPAVYACYIIYVLLGSGIRSCWVASDSRRQTSLSQSGDVTAVVPSATETCLERTLPIVGATLIGLLVFFLVTNFAVWWMFNTYPKTWEGLVACYVAAIPFVRNQLMGDTFYVVVLFGGYELLKQRMPGTKEVGLLYP